MANKKKPVKKKKVSVEDQIAVESAALSEFIRMMNKLPKRSQSRVFNWVGEYMNLTTFY